MNTLSKTLKSKRRPIPISLTPLIDVVFILLVFFMLASSFEKKRAVELIPPKQGKSAALSPQDQPITVHVVAKDLYRVDAQNYTLDKLNGFLDDNREKTILIKSGKEASLQDLVMLLDLSGTLSLAKISLLPFDETTP